MTAYNSAVLGLSPVHYYKFDETSGTPASVGSKTPTFNVGSGISLNQSSDVSGTGIYFGGTGSLSYYSGTNSAWQFAANTFNDRTFSVETWIKVTTADLGTGANNNALFSMVAFNALKEQFEFGIGGSTNSSGYAGKLFVRYYKPGAYGEQFTAAPTLAPRIDDNKWHHVVWVQSGVTASIYVDGELHVSTVFSSMPASFSFDANADMSLQLGANYTGTTTTNFYKGYMDEYALYSFPLSPSQILTNYINSDKPGYSKAILKLQPAPFGYFRLNETDVTGNIKGHINSTFATGTYTLAGTGGSSFIRATGIENNALQMNAYTGWTTAPSMPGLAATSTTSFWFKKNGAPGASTQILNWTGDASNYFNTSAHAYINTSGQFIFAPVIAATQQPSLTSTISICDNSWHHVVITRSGTAVKMYVDGLERSTATYSSSTAGGQSAAYTFGASGTSWDEFSSISTALTLSQIQTIYVAGGGSINAGYTAQAMTADATQPSSTVSVQVYVDYASSPMLVSALLSGNNYAGPTTQDTSYVLNIRTINGSSNTDAKNGFDIGSQYTNGSLDFTRGLAIKATSGVVTFGTVVKAKFDPAHVGVTTTNDVSPDNTFNIYVFDAAPSGTTWETMTTANMPAKTLMSTTRLIDDGSSAQFHLDLTTAVNDIRSLNYGMWIEHVGTPNVSGTTYDRTTFTGNSLDTKLMYILHSDIINKDVNAAAMTVDAEMTAATVDVQVYVNITDGVATASADIVTPTIDAQGWITVSAPALTASADAVQPVFSGEFVHDAGHFEADGRMGLADPVVLITNPIVVNAMVATVSGELVDPGFHIGEDNLVEHFSASATFVTPKVILDRTVQAMYATVTGEFPGPAITTEMFGVIKAAPMLAGAKTITPPAFYQLIEDRWYAQLLTEHLVPTGLSTNNFKPAMLLFNQVNSNISPWPVSQSYSSSTNIYANRELKGYLPTGGVDLPATSPQLYVPVLDYNGNQSGITPTLEIGHYDFLQRRAVRFNNIGFSYENTYNTAHFGVGFTLEFTIKTTKSNQIMFAGMSRTPSATYPISSVLGLVDGVIYTTNGINFQYNTPLHPKNPAFAGTQLVKGRKRIDDGNWHHVIIQFGYSNEGRIQYWIDGQLDIQSLGNTMALLHQVGYNSSSSAYSSDFILSTYSFDPYRFNDATTNLVNYYAAIDYTPIHADPMLATADISQKSRGEGNRGRALMLYWWPTSNGQNQNYITKQNDTGARGYFDEDTFDNILETWDFVGSGPQSYFGWDVFPVDINGYFVSDLVNESAYGAANIAIQSTDPNNANASKYKVNTRGYFRDPILDTRRYIDLMNDIDLNKFDAIFFRNFPDQSDEIDQFARNESVDEYFGSVEKTLYEAFLKSLRSAVDTGISLYVTNHQLAIDLGIVDRVEEISDLDDYTDTLGSDTYTPTILPSDALTWPVLDGSYARFEDSYKNNRLRVVNTVEGLTDIPTIIWTDTAYYRPDDSIEYGSPNRPFNRYEDRPNGLGVGDELVISDYESFGKTKYLAVPFGNVKAGTIVTAFGANIRNGLNQVENPYRNYATSIAINPGDILNGAQVGGKIYVNFTERISPAQLNDRPHDAAKEGGQIDLIQDYWINWAYDNNAITLTEKNQYLADPDNIDRLLEGGKITQDEYNKRAYWSSNGVYVLGQGNLSLKEYETSRSAIAQDNTKTYTKINKDKTLSTTSRYYSSNQFFSFTYSWAHPRLSLKTPSMLTRGFWWLSNRNVIDGLVTRPVAKVANTEFIMPVVTTDRILETTVQPMLATATINETNLRGGDVRITTLPALANASFTGFVRNINATAMTAAATFRQESRILTSSVDEIILYVMHEDPILYVREEIIK